MIHYCVIIAIANLGFFLEFLNKVVVFKAGVNMNKSEI